MSLFELTESDLEKFTGEEGFVASLGGFLSESFMLISAVVGFFRLDWPYYREKYRGKRTAS